MGEKTCLPPGFRFHPTDVELVSYYLKRKVMGRPFQFMAISDIDLYKFSPWDLPDKSHLRSKDLEWFFFCQRDKKYPKGTRANRSTETGYWKTTGQDRTVTLNSRTVGLKKTLIFHSGKPPRGERTDWVMYEYRLCDPLIPSEIPQDAYVLCKIFKKSGLGPKIGEQYGAPFNEEEWEEYDGTDLEAAFPFLPHATATEPDNNNNNTVRIPESNNNNKTVVIPESNNNNNKKTVIIPELIPQSLATHSIASQSFATQSVAAHSVATQSVATGDFIGAIFPCPVGAEMEGIQIDELAHLLMDSPYRPENAFCQLAPQLLDTDTDGIYNELTSLVNSIPDSNNTSVQPALAELGTDNYLELNDIFALETTQQNRPFDWSLIQDNYREFPQYPSQDTFMYMGRNLYTQGQNGQISELDHVVNPLNDFGPDFWAGKF